MQKTHVLLLILLTKIAAFGQTSGIPFIKVDQFGYLPNQEKVAVLSNPQTGFNASDSYTPGTVIEVRKVSDSTTVFSSAAAVWNSGASHGQSGDKVRWFDFSSLTAYGEYFIYDPDNDVYSESFRINDLVYKDALREFESILQTDSESELAPGIEFWFGEFYYDKGDFEPAAERFTKAIRRARSAIARSNLTPFRRITLWSS